MSAPVSLNPLNVVTRRIGPLAAASGLLATASVAVTLAVSAGGGTHGSASSGGTPEFAKPDRATLYHRSATPPSLSERIERTGVESGRRAAERFHHFR